MIVNARAVDTRVFAAIATILTMGISLVTYRHGRATPHGISAAFRGGHVRHRSVPERVGYRGLTLLVPHGGVPLG